MPLRATQSATPYPGLKRLDTLPSLWGYVRGTWQRREFAVALAAGELRGQNMDTALGNLWHILNPLLLVGVYYLIFGVLLEVTRAGVDNVVAFLAVGIFTFHYTQKTTLAGARSIVNNVGLIRSIAFPRSVLPLSIVAAQTLAFIPAVGVMLTVSVATGEVPHYTWLALVPIFMLQGVFNLGAALIVARLTDSFQDLQNLLPYVFRVLFYLSGILYSVDRFVTDPNLRLLFDFNPLYAFATLARGPILHETVDLRLLGINAVWTVVLVVFGVLYFRAAEHRYGRG
jgi:teichoic acid transport system permease protein